MNNETNETFGQWKEIKYKGIAYEVSPKTPLIVEDKIKKFIDKLYLNDFDIIEISTEASKTVMLDLWVFNQFVSSSNIPLDHRFLINRKKHPETKKYGYRVRYLI